MRKMNKIVALSLVLAMALSMMASAASFKDQATINADLMDEINLLVALGVYSENGTGAGNFEPNGTITRAQAAKIIYVLKNKGVDNGATSWTGLNIFSDVEAGAWYEGYVNYCASTGILAGTGDGKYTPNGQLTGVELAKMLLVLIGYKADLEGYTGAKWDANILADAEAAGLFAEYELPVRGVITREWSAKMIVNALNATKVRYADGELVEMYNDKNEAITFKAQDLGLNEETHVLIATPNVKLVKSGSAANNTNGKNKLSAIGTFDNYVEFEYDANPELLGSMVTVLYKGNVLNKDVKVYGVTAHKDNIITDTAIDAVSYDAKNFEDSVLYYVDYIYTDAMNATETKAFFALNDAREIKMIDRDNNGKIDVVMTNSVAYGKVQYVNPTNGYFTVNNIYNNANAISTTKKADYDKLVFVDTVEKNDVIKVTFDFATGVKKTVVEKLDVVTGAISKFVDGVFTIDGVAYENHANGTNQPTGVDKVARNYFVDGKYIVCKDDISTTKEIPTNVAYVIKAQTVTGTDVWGAGTSKKQVEILKNDGTQEILEYKTYTSNKPEGYAEWTTDVKVGSIMEYVMVDGKVYFKALDREIATSGNGTVDVSENKFTVGTTTYLMNEDTYFFVVKADNKYAVVKGSELKADINTVANSTIMFNESGFKYVTCAVLDDSTTAASSAVVAIAANQVTQELNDKNETIYKLDATKLDGTPVVLMAKNDTVLKTVKGKFMTYKLDANGYIVDADTKVVTVGTADALKYADGNAIVLRDASYMELAKDAKIYYVDAYKSNNEDRIIVSEGEGFVLSVETAQDTFANSVLYTKNTEGKITQLIMEINGEAISSAFYN